jgi:hypothetical protein
MPCNTIHDGYGLDSRIKSILDTRTKLATLKGQLTDDLSRKKAEVVSLVADSEDLTKVIELIRHLMDQMIDTQVKAVERIGTEGLRTVFPDLNLSLEADVGLKYNKIAVDFFFRRGDKEHPSSHRGHPLGSFGGGPASLVSLVLRILAVKKLNLAPFLLLDESLGAVSDEYIDYTSQFIRALSKELGFDILLVTHKHSFLSHANQGYVCQEDTSEDGSTHLGLKKVI